MSFLFILNNKKPVVKPPTFLKLVANKPGSYHKRGLFKCDCGKEFVTRIDSVKKGDTKSCGCLLKRVNRYIVPGYKHGHSKLFHRTRNYETWRSMLARCSNPKRIDYKYYGGRGIKICKRWKIFENFLKDMGPRPKGKTIDRIDNNKGYYKTNCKWSTPKEQANNRRR